MPPSLDDAGLSEDTEAQPTPRTPVQILARALSARGVQRAFGMPGGATLPLLDALAQVGIDFVLVRHEGAAGFMAEATAALTGTPGVCISTLGPGATNLVSGVTAAWLERTPMIAITSQCATDLQGIYTHQIIDQLALFRPITKHSVQLSATEAWRQIPLALRALDLGRPGPVHIDIPADVATALQPGALPLRRPVRRAPAPASSIQAAAEHLGSAQRPVVLAGLGALVESSQVAAALARLAQVVRAPVLTTYKAKGIVDEGGGWSAGAFGLSPVVDALQQELLAQSDLVVAVGLDPVELRGNWLPGLPAEVPLVRIDPWADNDLLHPVALDLVGDVALTLDALPTALSRAARSRWTPVEVAAHRTRLAAVFGEPEAHGTDGLTACGPAAAVRALRRACPRDCTLTMDVGAHRITASHVWTSPHPKDQLQSNGLCSMGTALPAAIAARLVHPDPDHAVLCLTGDAGLWMSLGELGVAQDHGLDLVVVYFSDRSLSLIELKQERAGTGGGGTRFSNPEVGPLALAFGGHGVTVRDADALERTVERAFQRGGLWIVEVQIDPAHYRHQM